MTLILIDITTTGKVVNVHRQHRGVNVYGPADKALHIIGNSQIHAVRFHNHLLFLSAFTKQEILCGSTPEEQEYSQQQQEYDYSQAAAPDTLLKSAFLL